MRDSQVATYLQGWTGFVRGVISSNKPYNYVNLSQVLEVGPLPPKYYLSPKAARGILRRAEARGRELPAALTTALSLLAASKATQPTKPTYPKSAAP